MTDKITEQIMIESYHNSRPFLADISYVTDNCPKPVIIFVHGFKGFKDWGHFNILANEFANAGFVFYKFNFSLNGTTIDSPNDFADLDAFGENNFTKELDDIKRVIDYVHSSENKVPKQELNLNKIFIIGHSRGGGVSIIKAAEDDRIAGLATWAAVNNFTLGMDKEKTSLWKEHGVYYVDNARTNQKMPLKWQIYEDVMNNKYRLDPMIAMSKLSKPTLIIHGDQDETVPVDQAHKLVSVNSEAELFIINEANHVFGGSHPFEGLELHPHTVELLNKTVSFFQNI